MYDLHNKILLNKSNENVKQTGVKGLGVVFNTKLDIVKLEKIKQQSDLDIVSVLQINAKRSGDVKSAVDQFRKKVEVIMVNAENVDVARTAAEMLKVDIISHAFVDQPTAREAAKNNVALEINFRDILEVYGMKRANLLSKMKFTLELARKYNTPLVITTGAHSLYEMRTPKQLMLTMEAFGFKHDEAKKAIFQTPRKIVETNRKKLSGEIIAEGVEKIK